MTDTWKDIHPSTPVAALRRDYSDEQLVQTFAEEPVAALAGMSLTFIRKVLGKRQGTVNLAQVLLLLDQDAFSETFVPRSKIPGYLLERKRSTTQDSLEITEEHHFVKGNAKELIPRLPKRSVQCVITSTPYWGTRLYDEYFEVEWADGETCPLGHEQTPEGFVRHTIELLYLLKPAMTCDGSVWWNLMDTYNTRTQIRRSASETLRAMQGKDSRSWKDYPCRRYSAGHAYLKDGEQCLIPAQVAERASRIGYWVKSTIVWNKDGSMPEPVNTRVTRALEFILHLSLQRSPSFDKSAYRRLPPALGGRNPESDPDKITDIWSFPTSPGTNGHGAQFPLMLPARCIALSSKEGDLVLDPFVGSGTTSLAAVALNRRSLGFDVSRQYLQTARERLAQEQQPAYEQERLPEPQPADDQR
jgi:DNA methylase